MRPVFGPLRAIALEPRTGAFALLWATGGKLGIAQFRVTQRYPGRGKWRPNTSESVVGLLPFRAPPRMVAPLGGQTMSGEQAMTRSSATSLPAREQAAASIDQVHLERMTLGDRTLEREVLELFARQTAMTLERIAGSGPACAAAAAHTLKGSARGIGAWRVAEAAERLEQAAAGDGDEAAMLSALADLEAASLEARLAIGLRLSEGRNGAAASRGREH
jgi:HPt (histidine-containing phosphotransfer) domain-containing protein